MEMRNSMTSLKGSRRRTDLKEKAAASDHRGEPQMLRVLVPRVAVVDAVVAGQLLLQRGEAAAVVGEEVEGAGQPHLPLLVARNPWR